MHFHIPHRSRARAPAREHATRAREKPCKPLSARNETQVRDSINDALEDCYTCTGTYHPHLPHRYTSLAGACTVLITRTHTSAGYATMVQYHGEHGGWYCYVGRAQSELFPMHPP